MGDIVYLLSNGLAAKPLYQYGFQLRAPSLNPQRQVSVRHKPFRLIAPGSMGYGD